jgi:hypothetical protein
MERCLSNGLHRRPWLGFPYPEEAGRAPGWAAGVVREGKEEKPAPTEAGGCILPAGREGNMAILVQWLQPRAGKHGCGLEERSFFCPISDHHQLRRGVHTRPSKKGCAYGIYKARS